MIIDRLTLMMIDEVHILNESRGATLEVVVSRMKERTSGKVRFVAVSASVPNIDDVARWIGTRPRFDQAPDNPTDVEGMSKAEIFKVGGWQSLVISAHPPVRRRVPSSPTHTPCDWL